MTTDAQNHHDESTADRDAASLRADLDGQRERILEELGSLVEIPSVAWDVHDAGEVWRSARAVAQLAEEAGLPEVEILTAARPDGEQGMPAVVARRRASPGQPTVMLYAHHDVQPVSDPGEWQTEPFRATPVGDRLHGRGAADDKAGVMVHIAAVRALLRLRGEDPGVGITLFVEGEEEAGSPSFENFLREHRDRLAADAIVVADSANWKRGVPALTSSLRGVISGTVRLRALGHALHSGVFGGPLVDANVAMVRLLSTLHDDAGAVAVPGLVRSADPELEYSEEDFRGDAGVPEALRLTGRGSIASRLWSQPALSIIGMDITPVEQSSNTLAAAARARVSLRLAPGQDPHEAHRLLEEHLLGSAPWGVEVEYEAGEAGRPFEADTSSPAARAVLDSMRSAWGVEPVLTGLGGSIPFVASLVESFPEASILITGVEDPDTRAHSANESLYLPDFFKAIDAEASFLLGMAGTGGAGAGE